MINESAAVLQKAINIKRLIKNGLFTREGCSFRSSPICRHTQSTATYRPRVYLINSPYDGTHSPDRKLRLFMQCENYDLKDHYLLASKPQMEPFKRGGIRHYSNHLSQWLLTNGSRVFKPHFICYRCSILFRFLIVYSFFDWLKIDYAVVTP